MPEFTATDLDVLAHVAAWYRDHRGALGAQAVSDATGIPCSQVSASAAVLAAAGRVRTYSPPGPQGAGREVVFVGLMSAEPRVVDLTALASWGPRARRVTARA
ncbi:hypothetical protein [Kineococcus sp. NUM-3379]